MPSSVSKAAILTTLGPIEEDSHWLFVRFLFSFRFGGVINRVGVKPWLCTFIVSFSFPVTGGDKTSCELPASVVLSRAQFRSLTSDAESLLFDWT